MPHPRGWERLAFVVVVCLERFVVFVRSTLIGCLSRVYAVVVVVVEDEARSNL